MLISKNKVVNAIWLDSSKSVVQVTLEDPKSKVRFVEVIPASEDEQDWRDLLSKMTPDQIEASTKEFAQAVRQEEERVLVAYAKEQGLIYDPSKYTPNTKLNINFIFDLPENQAGTDFLFELKLRVFDLEQVAGSDNQELKKKIRNAESPIEVLYLAGKFLYE